MKLTDIFLGNRQVTETQKNEQPDYAKTASLNRQIKSMVPGQTIQGEIVSKDGNEIQIKLSDDMVMNARLEQNMNLEVGKNMTFEVRNNGSVLSLSPLFANMATDANALKALDMALLPVNETTVEMTSLMMDAGLAIDKNSLQQVYREINMYPDAETADIVDLHKLSMPVDAQNVEQIASYKNLTHSIISGMTDITSEIGNMINSMTESGDIEGAARLYGKILTAVLDEGTYLQENGMTDAEGSNPEILNQEVLNPDTLNPDKMNPGMLNPEILNPEKLNENVSGLNSDKVIFGTGELKSDNAASKENAGVFKDVVINNDTVSVTENTTDKALSLLRDLNLQEKGPEELNTLISRLTGQDIPSGADQTALIKMAAESIEKALNSNDTKALGDLLGNNELKKLFTERLESAWTIKPEDVADEKKVEELYQRIDRQLKGLAQAFESEGATSQSAYKAVSNMSDNIDFLHQLNQMYAYVQLPIKLNQGNAHGDLYVYTNKKNLASKDGKVSALLHLDMENLGPVDVYVSLENTNVNTKFYVQDDDMLDFLSEHMDILTQRLEKRGYNCSFGMQVRGEDEEKEGGVNTILKQEGHVALSQYAFDVRA